MGAGTQMLQTYTPPTRKFNPKFRPPLAHGAMIPGFRIANFKCKLLGAGTQMLPSYTPHTTKKTPNILATPGPRGDDSGTQNCKFKM